MSNDKVVEIIEQVKTTEELLMENRRVFEVFSKQLEQLIVRRGGRKSRDDVEEGELDAFEYYYSTIDWLEDKLKELKEEEKELSGE